MGWQDRHTVIPAVYVLLRQGSKVLLMRRYNTGYADGLYSLPAGHLDGGEPAKVAMVREIKEETDVVVAPEDLQLAHTMHRLAEEGSHERIDLYFETTKWQGEPRIMEPNKCDDIQWFDVSALPTNIVPVVRQAFDCIASGTNYSEANFT
ncbi:MAG TPA: NUDIX domain-containing protein [Patescibacteria group bacterium]|nr:NUDIX domain-containing protein [Patescibacteria group bacterium]